MPVRTVYACDGCGAITDEQPPYVAELRARSRALASRLIACNLDCLARAVLKEA